MFIGNWPVNYRLLKSAVGLCCSTKHVKSLLRATNREDKSMRNIAFSIMLTALAVLQIAVVSAALFRSPVQATRGASEVDARPVLAATETKRKASMF